MSKWQPIETAPKDGTRVLLFREGYEPVIGYWDKDCGSFYHADEEADFPYGPMDDRWAPTDWQPLPEPPAPSK